MTEPTNPRADKQFWTLERWKTLEVEQAQAHHAAQQAKEQEDKAAVDHVMDQIEQAQTFARSQVDSAQPLSPDTLYRLTQYTAVQQDALRCAEEALRNSQERVEEAHSQLLRQAEQLFGVERLRERRQEQATVDAARKEQRQLDDFALLRVSIVTDKKSPRE